jgi:hypothetical protein
MNYRMMKMKATINNQQKNEVEIRIKE